MLAQTAANERMLVTTYGAIFPVLTQSLQFIAADGKNGGDHSQRGTLHRQDFELGMLSALFVRSRRHGKHPGTEQLSLSPVTHILH